MSSSDIWGDVKCPNCKTGTVHVWFYDTDCRYNDQSDGSKACKKCFKRITDEQLIVCLNDLREQKWGKPKRKKKK